jgi:predicted nucleotidyltransferase
VSIEVCLDAITRFRACRENEPLVLDAFLGGSFAANCAREDSDVDVCVISTEADCAGLLDGVTFPLL